MELIDIVVIIAATGAAGYFLWKKFFLAGGCGCGSGCSDCGDGCSSEKEKMEKVYGIKEREIPIVPMANSEKSRPKK